VKKNEKYLHHVNEAQTEAEKMQFVKRKGMN